MAKKHKHIKKKKGEGDSLGVSGSVIFGRAQIAKALMHELKLKVMLRTFVNFCKLIPRMVWTFYVESLLVPTYRYEWAAKYREWDAWGELHRRSAKALAAGMVTQNPTVAVESTPTPSILISVSESVDTKDYWFLRHDHQNCSRLRINVGGRIFETQIRTLKRFPDTLLGNPERRLPFYDPANHYYYFDRNRECFENVLYFYQSGGRLLCPTDFSSDIFLSEIEFFDLGLDVIRNYQLDEGLEQEDENASINLPRGLFQRKLWLLFEYPSSSAQATLVSMMSVYVILVSVIVFCLETELYGHSHNGLDYEKPSDADFTDPLNFIEILCVCWFTTELLIRFFVCPDKIKFLMDFMNIVDIVAILPLVVNFFTPDAKSTTVFSALRVIRLVRVFRIFKLSRHVKGLKILGWTLNASFNELGLLIFFLIIGVVLFSSALYFAEDDEKKNSSFPSIPQAFFWAVTTMTTVGYGDAVPKKWLGKLVGSLCAITGVLTLALPVPVMVSNFNYFYNQEISRNRSITDHMETHHVEMCCFLPGHGVHPDAKPEDVTSIVRKRNKSKRVPFSKNPYNVGE